MKTSWELFTVIATKLYEIEKKYLKAIMGQSDKTGIQILPGENYYFGVS